MNDDADIPSIDDGSKSNNFHENVPKISNMALFALAHYKKYYSYKICHILK